MYLNESINNRVSVIIPTYNRADKIVNCVESAVNQSYKSIEVIVVDDGSKDNTEVVLNRYIKANNLESKVFYCRQENAGAPAARNRGLKMANGEYVVFFDSDDLMLPERIEKQIQKLRSDDADCCACGFYYNSSSGKKYTPGFINNNLLESFIRKTLWGSTQSWLFKKDLILKVNGFDESLQCFQDSDLTFRVLCLHPKVSIVEEPLSLFIDETDSKRITSAWLSEKGLLSIKKYHNKVINFLIASNSKSLFKYEISAFYRNTGYKYLKAKQYKAVKNNYADLTKMILPLDYWFRLSMQLTYLQFVFKDLIKSLF